LSTEAVGRHYSKGLHDCFLTSTPLYLESVHNEIMNNFDFKLWRGSQIKFVDLGCGNGASTARVLASLNARNETRPVNVLCVDPHISSVNCESLHQAFPSSVKAEFLSSNAATFSALKGQKYTHILLKEMVHHCTDHDQLFKGIFEQLEPEGKMLVVTRPVETDYPFFPRLREIWSKSQPPIELFENSVRNAGFSHQVTKELVYNFTVDKNDVISWIRSRCWSEFSSLTQEEMDIGCDHLNRTMSQTITFYDKTLHITATK